MPNAFLTSSVLRARFLASSGVLGAVILVTTAYSMSAGYANVPYATSGSNWYSSHPVTARAPTPAQQAATLSATQIYRRQIVTSAESFSGYTASLASAIAAGDLSAARRDELAAQAAYDVLRPAISVTVPGSDTLDPLVSDQNVALGLSGLHAIERALWIGSIQDAATPARLLKDQGYILPIFLFRTILTPQAICINIDESLSWTVEHVISASQEVYSHHDLLDVRATTDGVVTSAYALVPLGNLVDPLATRALVRRVDALARTVRDLAPDTVDAAVPASSWRIIAQEMDAAAIASGDLGGSLAGLGSGRPYA